MKSTWTLQVFNKYNDELNEILWANRAVVKQTYSNFKQNNANWIDLPSDHLLFDVPKGEEVFKSLKDWSVTHNNFNSWTNLNALLALTSNLETYIATVVSLALESDPGILYNSSKSIDGIVLLKQGAKKNQFHDNVITSITKGDWNARLSAFKKTFGSIPNGLENNIGKLEEIRKQRNRLAHAFGRDIEGSRNHEVKDIIQMEKLSDSQLKKAQYIIADTTKVIDEHLLKNHIGEYQIAAYYHRIFPNLKQNIHQSDRAIILKKEIGKFGDISGKEFCKGLVKYYEAI
jgi:hypothetical protein